MPIHLKKLGVKIGIRILQGLIALKKGLAFFLFILSTIIRSLLRTIWFVSGRPLVLVALKIRHAMRAQQTPMSRPLVIIFAALLGATLLFQLATQRERSSSPTEIAGGTDTTQALPSKTPQEEPLLSQTLAALPVIPGEENAEPPLPAIAGGNALLAPMINTTRLESRLRDAPEKYIVQEGDTISDIAEQFGISVTTILWENKLSLRSLIRPGMELTILPVSGLSHEVRRGETIASIARRYKVEERAIMEFNELNEGATIALGQRLIIPEGEPPSAPLAQRVAPRITRLPAIPPPSALAPGVRMLVPTTYRRISQWFTWRHSGIDMATNYGTPIYAAKGGTVVQSGWGTGYGLFVLIDHGDGLMTRYAHNSKNYVKRGDRVARGQTIALIGSTGRSTGPHVHFETIVNGRFVNPLRYIKL